MIEQRNVDRLCIDYVLRPRLSSRLTLVGRTLSRKPWVYGEQNSHLFYRYSCLHSHWSALHLILQFGFAAPTTLSYQSKGTCPLRFHSFGTFLIANHFRRDITR